MNIVFITNNYTPYSGGVVSSINAIYDELVRQGHAVTIITLDFGTSTLDERNIIRLWCPIKFRYKQNPMAVPLFARRQLKQIITRINPDVIHLHHPFLLGPLALNIARKLNKPTVFTYHTLYEKYVHHVPLPGKLAEYVTIQRVRAFCKQVNGIIAPSATVAKLIKQANPHTSVTVIPSPIDPLFFCPAESMHLQKRIRFNLLTVSRFTKEKNIPFLLDMFAHLSDDYTLTLVGYGNELANLQHHAYITLNLPQERVQFVIRPTKEALRTYYTNADLFVYASQTETQGLVMLEAMACGTAVVAVHGPGQQDFVENGVNGYLVDSVHEMRKIVENIKENEALRRQLKKGALLTAQSYRAQVIIEKLIEFYRTKTKL